MFGECLLPFIPSTVFYLHVRILKRTNKNIRATHTNVISHAIFERETWSLKFAKENTN